MSNGCTKRTVGFFAREFANRAEVDAQLVARSQAKSLSGTGDQKLLASLRVYREQPKTIGRYRIDKVLGQGAMGKVFLGFDPELDRKVAIKTVRDVFQDEQAKTRFLARFRNEAKAAARLSHPAIVQVYDVGVDADMGPYLVFEFIAGNSLKEVLDARGAIPPKEALYLLEQIAIAIDTAHGQQIVHRDIKPDNIMVTEGGIAKLADFGIARIPNAALTKEGQFLGTPCYAAPETLLKGLYGPRSDYFSFGALAYEVLTGKRAFPGDDAIGVASAVMNDEPKSPSSQTQGALPVTVDAVVSKMIHKDDKQRFGSAEEFVHALAAALGETLAPMTVHRAPSSKGASSVIIAVSGLVTLTLLYWAYTTIQGPTEIPLIADAGVDSTVDAVQSQALVDAAIEPAQDAALEVAVDQGVQPLAIENMSRLEREERAIEALDRARSAIDRGEIAQAMVDIEVARQLDPTNTDVDELELLLR